jgi:EmrB/QacA subfamily drug resistance transporter
MARTLAQPAEKEEAWRRRPVALTVLCTLLFLTFLDNTVVSVALASIQTDLRAGVSSLQWVVGAYALPFAALMLTFGMISDQFGRKKVMLAGAGLYCAGAALSALAPGIGILITGRAVMGVGAAASEPGTLSMIRQLYEDRASRNRALGIWAAVSGFALALGPVLGGILVGLWSWRGIFWFDVTFGLAALVAGVMVLPENSDPDAGRVDLPGTLLGFGCVGALAFAVIEGETSGFLKPEQLVLYGAGIICAIAFVLWERRCPHPLLDTKFLRIPQFVTPNVIAFCCYFATFAIFFFTALYLAEVAGYSGYRIAAVFLPMAAVMIVTSVLAGRWTTTAGTRWSLTIGCAVFTGGLIATNAVLSAHPSYPLLAVSLAVAGAGLGACVVPITSSVLEVVPGERSGMAASATNTSREIGAVAGVVVLGAIVSARLQAGLVARMMKLHLPAAIQSYIISTVQSGGGVAALAGGGADASKGGIFGQLFQAGYAAFGTALHDALYLSAALLALAAVLAAATLRRSA